MKVRCINRPPYTMCPPEVDVPSSHTSIAVAVPVVEVPQFVLEPAASETFAHKVGTVPIRRVQVAGGWEWVADFNELAVP